MNLPRIRLALVGQGLGAILLTLALSASDIPAGAPTSSPVSSPRPAAVAMTPTPWVSPTATPSPTPSPTPLPPTSFPVSVVVPVDDPRANISLADLAAAIRAGQIIIPCEFSALGLYHIALVIAPIACTPAADITPTVHNGAGLTAILPPGLVSPSIKVLSIDGADIFGRPSQRLLSYPLYADTYDLSATWTAYNSIAVKTLISTGDTCPDTGVSYMAVTKRKGWPWVLDGGTVHYLGTKPDPFGWGWQVPVIYRHADAGVVSALISDNDVGVNDFECPMIEKWVQHDNVKVFNVDPAVASLLATEGGVKAVTLGSNHITDAGQSGVLQTLAYLDQAGIAHTGAGKDLADALAPAVVNAGGVRFAFVGWDDITGSAAATDTRPGAAPMTDENVCASIKAARDVADIVIAMPQWGWPEYHANSNATERAQRDLMYTCGADGILGSGTHWASWVQVVPGGRYGPYFAIGSHGNFLFTQSWSRQTMEGVIVELTFYGKKLVQFRLHPYVVYQGAQPNLIDPATDGSFVLRQVWDVSVVE